MPTTLPHPSLNYDSRLMHVSGRDEVSIPVDTSAAVVLESRSRLVGPEARSEIESSSETIPMHPRSLVNADLPKPKTFSHADPARPEEALRFLLRHLTTTRREKSE